MIKKILSLLSATAFLITGMTACGTQTNNILPLENTQSQQTQISSVNRNISSYSDDVKLFVANASKLGVKLTDEQLRTISIQRHVAPNGKWASRPAENLTAEQNLDVHFRKHKAEFNIKTKEDYLQRAVAFQKKTGSTVTYYFDITSFAKGYQSNVVKFDSKTREFGAKKPNGEITTYYTNDTPAAKRFIVVPEDFNF